jgi:stage V sporulation protein K
MYPKQIYQAQSLYLKNKDNFRDIKIKLYETFPDKEEIEDFDSIFNTIVIKDLEFISRKLGVEISYQTTCPEFYFLLSFIAYLVDANHLIAGLQGNDINVKLKLIDYFEKLKSINFKSGYIIQILPQDSFYSKSYRDFLSAFIQGLIAADQNISTSELSVLNELSDQLNTFSFGEFSELNLVPKHQNNSNSIPQKNSISNEENESISDVLNELDSYTGMDGIKRDIRTLINLLKIQKQRENQGLTVVKPTLHMVFTGPPGTGKTTVGRIMGRVFKALGVLNKGHVVEVDRSGLVAGYVGQTAIKVDEVVQQAKDGILFIDEAYTLSPADGQDSFGQEAIDTLLKRMEDFRDSLVVIVAGYEEEMQRFIESNPGFKSRFNKYINFEDYKPNELIEIFKAIVKRNNYIASNDLLVKLNDKFNEIYISRTKSFGNGRVVRNLFEKIIENQSNRLAQHSGDLSENDLQILEVSDLDNTL